MDHALRGRRRLGGDVLRAVLRRSPHAQHRARLAAVLMTELIEFSELWHSPWLDALRATRDGGFLLGHVFLWSDVVCVALGATLAAGAERAWRDRARAP